MLKMTPLAVYLLVCLMAVSAFLFFGFGYINIAYSSTDDAVQTYHLYRNFSLSEIRFSFLVSLGVLVGLASLSVLSVEITKRKYM